jgi:hypothetical protein
LFQSWRLREDLFYFIVRDDTVFLRGLDALFDFSTNIQTVDHFFPSRLFGKREIESIACSLAVFIELIPTRGADVSAKPEVERSETSGHRKLEQPSSRSVR